MHSVLDNIIRRGVFLFKNIGRKTFYNFKITVALFEGFNT